MPEQRDIADMGGTMRLGTYPCALVPAPTRKPRMARRTPTSGIAIASSSTTLIARCWSGTGWCFPAFRRTGGGGDCRAGDHPFMVGSQFHPEFKSRPTGRTRCSRRCGSGGGPAGPGVRPHPQLAALFRGCPHAGGGRRGSSRKEVSRCWQTSNLPSGFQVTVPCVSRVVARSPWLRTVVSLPSNRIRRTQPARRSAPRAGRRQNSSTTRTGCSIPEAHAAEGRSRSGLATYQLDEALDLTAAGLRRIAEEHGPESVVFSAASRLRRHRTTRWSG